MDDAKLKTAVREHYARAARRVGAGASCCGGAGADEAASPGASRSGEAPRSGTIPTAASCCSGTATECGTISRELYAPDETRGLPEGAVLASLGCGNPTALAELQAGETVLDLGSGGGIDVLLSARRVGPAGKAFGLDMTDEMLELARENQRRTGLANVEFLKGDIESVPLPGGSVDVIISNCVINLAADKDRVLREAFRVLRPGGRLAVSDIVVRRRLPEEARRSLELWAGCVAGALEEDEYRKKLGAAGFEQITIEPVRVYTADDAHASLRVPEGESEVLAESLDGAIASAFIRARKPVS